MEKKKYEFTDETMIYHGHTLHRIRALKDFGDVKKGDLGGFIESEDNLSHEGDCWVGDNAVVYGDAEVSEDAKVYGEATVYENAWVYGNAKIYDSAEICGDAMVFGNAEVYEDVKVYGEARVCGLKFQKGKSQEEQ